MSDTLERGFVEYNADSPASWKESWQTDPPGGALSDKWPQLIASFRSRTPLGELAADFSAELIGGGEFILSSYRGKKSVLIVFGSLACPPCVTNISVATPNLRSLYEKHAAAIEFAYVYTREAHPGKNIAPHRSMDEKRANAKKLKELEGISFPLVVDTLDGRIQRLYVDPRFNNPVFLVNRAGVVVYKSAWLDSSELPQVLEDQAFWDERSTIDATIKKTVSERIRALREPYDPNCNQRFKSLMRYIGLPETGIGPVPGIDAVKLATATEPPPGG